jgi:hypothetical protein
MRSLINQQNQQGDNNYNNNDNKKTVKYLINCDFIEIFKNKPKPANHSIYQFQMNHPNMTHKGYQVRDKSVS